MNEKPPNLVALYSWGSGDAARVAEFRLTPEGQVVLTVIDPLEGRVAQEYYDYGVDFVAEGRTVRPEDGPDFMRALLRPFQRTYYHFIDESAQAEAS